MAEWKSGNSGQDRMLGDGGIFGLDVKRIVATVSYDRVAWRKYAEKRRRHTEILQTEYWGKA